MSRHLYECPAGELATGSVEVLPLETPAADAAAWLDEKGYDAAPVYDGDEPTGFVLESDVSTDTGGETLEDYRKPLTIDYLISGDAEFSTALSALVDSPVYFLGGHSSVSGILTRADLNTSPARIYLFDRITYLEAQLRELVLEEAPNWKDTPVGVEEIESIENRHADAQAANVALEEIHYAQFSTLETIVSSVEGCWRACGFSTEGSASTSLHEITQLRNDVAHANLVVENTDSETFLSSGRTTENLATTVETIERVLERLQAAGFGPEGSDEATNRARPDPV